MKNLAHLILALFATQLLIAGIAHAASTTITVDQKISVCAMPGDGGEPF